MRPFVVRLDPTPFDRAAASSSPGQGDLASLKQSWNAWNGKVRGLLDQGSRIENLFWRRWHMDQRQGPVQHASPSLPQANFPNDLSASVEAVERRRATEDLESFLRVTLQAAQPGGQAEVIHNPPTYDAFSIPTTSQPQPPPPPQQQQQAVQSSFQPPIIHAPQPQRLAFNPSPEWGYSALPSVSQPPPSSSAASAAAAHQNRIIATPSWTALISDPTSSGAAQAQAQAVQQQQQQQQQPTPANMPPPANALGFPPFYPSQQGLLTDPFAAAAAAAGFNFGAPPPSVPNPLPPPIPSPSFTLPPTATLFSDLPSALSSAPPAAAPPAFFSSYGMYQPVVAPYPRFLTPSPEPSVLGELELELGPATGEFVSGTAGLPPAVVEPDGMDSVWKDLESRAECGASGSGGGGLDTLGGGGGAGAGEDVKPDPFEGLSLAQMRSRANSLEAVDREAARFQAYGVGTSGLSMVDQAAREVAEAAASGYATGAGAGAGGAAKGKRKAGDGGAGMVGKKTKAGGGSPPLGSEMGDPSGAKLPAAPASAPGAAAATAAAGGKKNRNPHSTQLPGNGQRRQQKEEAGEGHDGPICSHCGSITTPLWRRGPDDELLCNACGLYLKLHGKSRPKTFGKNNGSKRSSNGAAAQAAASGVPPSCNNCGATSTPMWRKDQEGRLCCNACSLYYKLHKVPRPASLAQKRKAAAAAKANLAAAASSANPAKADLGGSPTNDTPPGQLPTPAASSETTPTAVPAETAPVPQIPPHLVPPPPPPSNPYQLPPAMQMQPGAPPPGGLPGLMHPHQALPPGWPPLPQGYPFPPPNGAAPPPPGYPLAHVMPQLHHPQPQLPHQLQFPQQQQQQQQGQQGQQKFSLPPAIPGVLPPSPFAQTAWGALAYGIVSAAAAEEAGGGVPGAAPNGGAQPPPP
ncbi:hypothetical protein JCM6882_002499 [Rhodosporidiobolus microsporus]